MRKNPLFYRTDDGPALPKALPQQPSEQIKSEAERIADSVPQGSALVNAADDAAAATAGVVVGGFYRNGSVVMVRVA